MSDELKFIQVLTKLLKLSKLSCCVST